MSLRSTLRTKWLLSCAISLLILLLAIGLFAAPLAAQSPVTGAALVRGNLDRQFAQHIFTVSAWDPAQPLTILLEYSPQGRWELDDRSGFFVFTQAGYENFRAGELPGSASIAAGDRLPGEGRRLQATIGAPIPGPFYVMVYNDSPLPMGYTLRATNGGFSDGGGQAFDAGAPAPAGGGDAPVFPFVIVPGPTPTPFPVRKPTPLRTSALRGLLDERYAQDFFTLEVVDTGLPLTVEMIYDPAEQILLIDSLNFWIFDEDQFRTQEISGSRPEFEPNRGAGTLIYRDDVAVWVARIEEPLGHYMLVVNQHAHALSVGYRLTVENGVLVDEGQQAQAVVTRPQPSLASGERIWVVQRGDTLGSIAERVYGDRRYAAAICARNGLTACSRIIVGQRLILPPVTATPPASIPSSQPIPRPTARPPSGAPVANNLLEVADGESSLQTFRDLIGQTSLADTLVAAGPYTLFAFTNDAFDALSVETQDNLLIDPDAALTLLSGHVVQGELAPDWITRAKNVVTLSGRLLRLEPDDDGTFKVNGIPILGDPIPAANGVIYLVDAVVE